MRLLSTSLDVKMVDKKSSSSFSETNKKEPKNFFPNFPKNFLTVLLQQTEEEPNIFPKIHLTLRDKTISPNLQPLIRRRKRVYIEELP